MPVPHKPEWMMWDHNAHYHELLLRHVPSGAKNALDVGCGAGRFARRLAERVGEVVAVDRDPRILEAARATTPGDRVRYVEADIMDSDLPPASFDFVSCIAALHHMPLERGLTRLRSLVAPGGVLAVLGLYKPSTPFDYAFVAVTGAVDLAVGVVRHRSQPDVRGSVIFADPATPCPRSGRRPRSSSRARRSVATYTTATHWCTDGPRRNRSSRPVSTSTRERRRRPATPGWASCSERRARGRAACS